MRIAVAYQNEEVFGHFGKTEQFKLYDVEDNRVVSTIVIDTNCQGHEALADVLANEKIDVVICGGIGQGARDALAAKGIQVCAGAEGKADAAVGNYLDGILTGSAETCAHHHEEGEGCCGGSEADCASGTCGGCCGGMPCTVTGKNAGRICVVHYIGTYNDGTQFDSSYDRGQPLEFPCGSGMMIRGFDEAVSHMDPGQKVSVHLTPEEAYGMPNPMGIVVVPIEELPGAEDLTVGERIILGDEYGRQYPVRVSAKDEKTVTLDANHEMAGKELNFEIELIEVRDD